MGIKSNEGEEAEHDEGLKLEEDSSDDEGLGQIDAAEADAKKTKN